MLPIWLLAAMMIMMYYWRFWEPWANAMLVVLLPKLWKSWLAQLFLDVFLGLTLAGPKKASKRTILHNRLNTEKTPGRCCQSGYLLPWWWWYMMMMMCYWRFWEPCTNAMLVVSLVSRPFRQRARALAENDSLQRVIRMQRVGESSETLWDQGDY